MRWLNLVMVPTMVALCAGFLSAQVIQTQTGQSLDANYQLGSGGYNMVNGGNGGVNSQLYVTGQVSGLAGFHGRVPTEAANQLRMNVPSAALGDFVRISVGTPQVMAGGAYATTAYYNPARTSFGVGGILGGQTPPGSSAATGEISAVAIQQMYSAVTQAYRTAVPATPGAIPQMTASPAPLTGSPVNIVSRPGSEALFGVPQYAQGTELALEVRRFLNDGRANAGSPPPAQEQQGQDSGAQDVGPTIGGQQTLGGPGLRELAAGTRGGRAGAVPLSNQDAYLDLLLTLQKKIEAEKIGKAPLVPTDKLPTQYPPGSIKTTEPPGTGHGGGTGKPSGTDNSSGAGRPPGTGGDESSGSGSHIGTALPGQQNLIEASGDGVIIHKLAGKKQDMFNMYMGRAQEHMKQGRYYDANKEYDMAIIINGSNPMARVGACLAIFGAGEPFSAAAYLKQAMTTFPPLMETRLDVASMMSLDAFKDQLVQLDQRIASEPGRADPLLMFLACYMHANLGETDKARLDATLLQADTEGNAFYQAYANYVLTGKRPDQAKPVGPASQPATAPSLSK